MDAKSRKEGSVEKVAQLNYFSFIKFYEGMRYNGEKMQYECRILFIGSLRESIKFAIVEEALWEQIEAYIKLNIPKRISIS